MSRKEIIAALVLFCAVAAVAWAPVDRRVDARSIVVEAFESASRCFQDTDRRLLQLFLRNYKFQLLGDATIDNIPAWVVVAKPKFRKQPCRQFWIDKSRRRILAFKDWTCRSMLKHSEKTSQLLIGIRTSNTDIGGTARACISLLPQFNSHTHSCRVARLPKGFEYVGTRTVDGVWHQDVYSDGLYVMSVFTRFPVATPRKNRNNVAVYLDGVGFLMRGRCGGLEYVVVGDLPLPELRRTAASIKPVS